MKKIALVADREGSLAYHIINAKSHTHKLQTLIIKTTNCSSAKRAKKALIQNVTKRDGERKSSLLYDERNELEEDLWIKLTKLTEAAEKGEEKTEKPRYAESEELGNVNHNESATKNDGLKD